MAMPDGAREIGQQALIASPSLAAIVSYLAGITVEKWLALAGIFCIVIQAAGHLWRLHRDVRHEQERRRLGLPPPDIEP